MNPRTPVMLLLTLGATLGSVTIARAQAELPNEWLSQQIKASNLERKLNAQRVVPPRNVASSQAAAGANAAAAETARAGEEPQREVAAVVVQSPAKNPAPQK